MRKNLKKLCALPVIKQRFLIRFREQFLESLPKSKQASQRTVAGKLQLFFIDFNAKY